MVFSPNIVDLGLTAHFMSSDLVNCFHHNCHFFKKEMKVCSPKYFSKVFFTRKGPTKLE